MLNPFSDANPDRRILVPVWCAADGMGIQAAILAPWLIGVYITDFGFAVAEAGLLLSIEFASLALVNFLISPFMDRLPRRTIALAGAVLVVGGNAASGFLDVWGTLAVARSLSGIGAGLAMAAGNATAAGARDPAQLYGHKTAMLAVYAFAMFLVIPPLVELLGPGYLFSLMALFNLAFVYPLRRIPQHIEPLTATSDEVSHRSTMTWVVAGLMIVAATLFYFTRDTMVYVFFEQIGADLSVSRQTIGRLIAISAVLAIFGPITSIWLAHRLKETAPIIAVVILGGLLAHVIVQTDSQWIYGFLVIWQGFLNLSGYALHMSLASALDPRGRLTAACGGSVLSAYAISPAMAGYFSGLGGVPALQLALVTCGTINVVLIITIIVLRKRVSASG